MGKQRKGEVEAEEKGRCRESSSARQAEREQRRWVDAIDRRNPRGKRDCCLSLCRTVPLSDADSALTPVTTPNEVSPPGLLFEPPPHRSIVGLSVSYCTPFFKKLYFVRRVLLVRLRVVP